MNHEGNCQNSHENASRTGLDNLCNYVISSVLLISVKNKQTNKQKKSKTKQKKTKNNQNKNKYLISPQDVTYDLPVFI